MMVLSIAEAVCYACLWAVICCSDIRRRIIPNKLLAVLMLLRVLFLGCGFFFSAQEATESLISSLAALLLTGAATALLYPVLRLTTGAGDFKLLMVCAFCLGLRLYLPALLAVLPVLAVVLAVQKKRKQVTSVPFTPYLCTAMLGAMVFSLLQKLLS